MMKKPFVFCLMLFAATCFIAGCCKKHTVEYEYSFAEVFPVTVALTGEEIPIDLLSPISAYRVGDYLVVLTWQEERFVHIYDALTYEHLLSVINKGRGSNETPGMVSDITQTFSESGNNRVWITGAFTFKGLLNIDKTLERGQVVFDKYFDFLQNPNTTPFAMMMMNVNYNVNDSVFLWLQPTRSYDEREYNPNSFYVFYDYYNDVALDTVRISDYKLLDDSQMRVLGFGTSYVRPDFKKAVQAFDAMDRIHIIDLETKNVKVVGFDAKPSSMLPSSEPKKFNIWVAVTQDHIFVLKQDDDINDGTHFINVLDWNGTPVKRIYLDRNLLYINTSDDAYLYGITEEEWRIVRYDISDLNL